MSKRLTRKQIKHDIREDEFKSVIFRTLASLQENPRVIVGTILGVLALAAVVSAALALLEHRQQKANEELVAAVNLLQAPIQAEGATPDDPDTPSFATEEDRRARAREALQEVGGGMASEVAELYLAGIAISEGDTATARSLWQDFLKDHRDHLLAVSVRLNLIHLDRQEGRAEELAEELRAELDQPERSLPEDVLLFELAKTLDLLEQSEEAMELYKRIEDEYPQSPYAAQAREMTASMT
ncbi:MAG: tetratricopeptide repeat protein [bacterium]|nr:tetratricopeptide repeat protein [bacterium]